MTTEKKNVLVLSMQDDDPTRVAWVVLDDRATVFVVPEDVVNTPGWNPPADCSDVPNHVHVLDLLRDDDEDDEQGGVKH